MCRIVSVGGKGGKGIKILCAYLLTLLYFHAHLLSVAFLGNRLDFLSLN